MSPLLMAIRNNKSWIIGFTFQTPKLHSCFIYSLWFWHGLLLWLGSVPCVNGTNCLQQSMNAPTSWKNSLSKSCVHMVVQLHTQVVLMLKSFSWDTKFWIIRWHDNLQISLCHIIPVEHFDQRLQACLSFLEPLKVEWEAEPSSLRFLSCRTIYTLDIGDRQPLYF